MGNSTVRTFVLNIFYMTLFILKQVRTSAPKTSICDTRANGELPGRYFPEIHKNIDCKEIMGSLLGGVTAPTWPPPRFPPRQMFLNMTQEGRMPIRRMYYFKRRYSGRTVLRWTNEYLSNMTKQFHNGTRMGTYGSSTDKFVDKVILKYRDQLKGKHGFVVGSERPWIEVLLLMHGAARTTTIEYGSIVSEVDKVNTMTPKEATLAYLNDEKPLFDFGFSYSSLEHSGLGRYGEKLDPCGDLVAMAMSWCLTKSGGLFFLNVPRSYDYKSTFIEFNAHRRYGPDRLKHMAASWKVLKLEKKKGPNQPDTDSIWVLKKP